MPRHPAAATATPSCAPPSSPACVRSRSSRRPAAPTPTAHTPSAGACAAAAAASHAPALLLTTCTQHHAHDRHVQREGPAALRSGKRRPLRGPAAPCQRIELTQQHSSSRSPSTTSGAPSSRFSPHTHPRSRCGPLATPRQARASSARATRSPRAWPQPPRSRRRTSRSTSRSATVARTAIRCRWSAPRKSGATSAWASTMAA